MKSLHEYTNKELKNMLILSARQVGKTYLAQKIYNELLRRASHPNSQSEGSKNE